MHSSISACLAALVLAGLCAGWDFHGVVPEAAPVVDVVVWDNRAFLALPRVWRDPRDAMTQPQPEPPAAPRRPGLRRPSSSRARYYDDSPDVPGPRRPRSARVRYYDDSPAVDSDPGPRNRDSGALTFLHDGPTLLEAQWPEPENASAALQGRAAAARLRRPPSAPRAFPRMEEQILGDPASLQSAVSLEVESFRGAARLWVLDSGEVPSHSLARLPPKVVVYNLRANNQKVWMRPFDGVAARAVSGLALDPTASDTRAYVGYPGAPGGSSLLVLSWRSKAFWQVRVHGVGAPSPQPQVPQTGVDRARPSSGRDPPRDRTSCWDVALQRSTKRRPRVVVSARDSQEIYDLSLDALRGPAPGDKLRNDALVPASELGARLLARKPGPSCGLLSDPAGGLLYFLLAPSPAPAGAAGVVGAVMRWDPLRGAGGQGHAIVYQDAATLPLASALFFDGQGAAWAACTTFARHHEHEPADADNADEDPDLRDDQYRVHEPVHDRDRDLFDPQDYDDGDEDEQGNDPPGRDAGEYRRRGHGPDTQRDGVDVDDSDIQRNDPGAPKDCSCTHIMQLRRWQRHRNCRLPRAVNGVKWDNNVAKLCVEPQEYVCMSPCRRAAVAPAVGSWPCPSCPYPGRGKAAAGAGAGRNAGEADDGDAHAKTIMVTRRAGCPRRSDASSPGTLRTLLLTDGAPVSASAHVSPAGPSPSSSSRIASQATLLPRRTVHCVKLEWQQSPPKKQCGLAGEGRASAPSRYVR